MANEFSVAIHQYISDKIEAAEKNQKDAQQKSDPAAAKYYEGQLRELAGIRRYMADKIDLKTQKYY